MVGIDTIAAQVAANNNITIKTSKELILSIFECIKSNVENGDKININGFGRFSLIDRKARNGIHPYTLKPIKIKSRTSLKFEVAKPYHAYLKDFNLNK